MRNRSRGFTLLEVLVSITLAVTLLGLAFVAFQQVQKAAQRNAVMTQLAVEAGYLYQRLDRALQACIPGSQFGVRRKSVPSSLYGGDHASELWFLTELPGEYPGNGLDVLMKNESEYTHRRMVWCGWQWRPPRTDRGEKVGTLWSGQSSASTREVKRAFGGDEVKILQGVQPRTSRKRELDDNDGQLLINAKPTTPRSTSDATDLWGEDRNLNGALDPGEDTDGDLALDPGNLSLLSSRVKRMTWQWIAYGGSTLTASAEDGIAPSGGAKWWNSDVRVVDGLYRDGRPEPADGGTVLQARPVNLRLELVLADAKSNIERTFSFTFAVTLDGAIQSGL